MWEGTRLYVRKILNISDDSTPWENEGKEKEKWEERKWTQSLCKQAMAGEWEKKNQAMMSTGVNSL